MPQELPEDLIDALAGGSGIGLDPSKADDIIRELKAKGWDSDQFAQHYLPLLLRLKQYGEEEIYRENEQVVRMIVSKWDSV